MEMESKKVMSKTCYTILERDREITTYKTSSNKEMSDNTLLKLIHAPGPACL